MVFVVSFGVLCAVCALLSYLQRRGQSEAVAAAAAARDPESKPAEGAADGAAAFQRFQWLYLAVFLLMMGTPPTVPRPRPHARAH